MEKDYLGKGRILLLSSCFIPRATVGVIRAAYFSRHLARKGWIIDVIKYEEEKDMAIDLTLNIYRLPSYSIYAINPKVCILKNNFNIGIFKTIVTGLKLSKYNHYDIIFGTGGPFTNLFTAWAISVLTKIPLVIDYRDPWTSPFPQKLSFKGIVFNRISRIVEGIITRKSSLVIVTTEKMKESMIETFPIVSHKIHTVLNGHTSYDDINVKYSRTIGKIRFVYTGKITKYYIPMKEFIESVKIIEKTRPDIYDKIEFQFYGSLDKYSSTYFNNAIIRYEGYINREDCQRIQSEADVLLSLDNSDTQISTKLFEYIAGQRPILNITLRNSAADNLFRDVQGIITIDYRDINGIANAIIKLANDILVGNEITPIPKDIDRFSRKAGADKLETLLNELMHRKNTLGSN